ncbi:Leucine-rich repeat-containing 33 [Gossypium arboreum]|uniref:Leucine-rich repeat-containing 33 n=2 Tax=Gossypium arboreum TaxID=29729 RepID=A0A0B0NXY6_GOSAR|nr:Leucine-rich repeat-containing 33 [Gossypium arboreum]
MKLCLNEVNLKLYRLRAKEIGLGSGKSKNSRIVDLHRSSISEGPSVKLSTLSSTFDTFKNPERAVADDVESVVPTPAHGAVPVESRPISSSHEGEAKQAFHQMMNEWFTQYIQTNPVVQQPSPPNNPSPIPVVPPMIDPMRFNRPPVDKIRKHGAEEFKANDGDDAERAEL